ncbi:hypothetical protein JTB14_007621 [Gonioctena quinquepunctata]|nr:hypothetical protein JTB14_007621 [Gonioctena quinquepunctata]
MKLQESVEYQAESVQNQSNNTSFSPTVMQPIFNVPPAVVSHSARQLPVSDWGLKFSGDSKELYNFIDRATEYAEARGLTKVDLSKAAVEWFSDNSFLWFLQVKNSESDWDGLVIKLKTDFLPLHEEDDI